MRRDNLTLRISVKISPLVVENTIIDSLARRRPILIVTRSGQGRQKSRSEESHSGEEISRRRYCGSINIV